MKRTVLKHRVDLSEATKKLSGRLRELKLGRLRSVIDFYIPYRLFQTEVTNGNKTVKMALAVDCVTGRLDPCAFDTLESKESDLLDPRRVARAQVSETEALEILKEKVKRDLYLRGFFKVKDPKVEGVFLETIYIPYWVGIYARGDVVKLKVINALGGFFEGAKVEEIVAEHFRASAKA